MTSTTLFGNSAAVVLASLCISEAFLDSTVELLVSGLLEFGTVLSALLAFGIHFLQF